MYLGGGTREAALVSHGQKHFQGGQVHPAMIKQYYYFVTIITLTSRLAGGYN